MTGQCKAIWTLLMILLVMFGACLKDAEGPSRRLPSPPSAPVGIITNVDMPQLVMVLLWAPASGGQIAGYNVYRKVGSGSVQKLNSTPVNETPFGPTPDGPMALAFMDTTFDVSSSELYTYYMKTVDQSGNESTPSDSVLCVPSVAASGDSVVGLAPADEEKGTSLRPEFSWTPRAGAESYLLYLQDGSMEQGPVLWVYRHLSPTTLVPLGGNGGVAYVPFAGDSLETNTMLYWGVWAIDADNCAFAEGSARFTTIDPLHVITIADGYLAPGNHRFCWPQKDEDGVQVGEGSYLARMIADQFETTVSFRIDSSAVHVPAHCDTIISGLPQQFAITVNSASYAVGDTVRIDCGLPQQARVTITIERDLP